jgi:hypothetical protein
MALVFRMKVDVESKYQQRHLWLVTYRTKQNWWLDDLAK